jgi:hypothetical protein
MCDPFQVNKQMPLRTYGDFTRDLSGVFERTESRERGGRIGGGG